MNNREQGQYRTGPSSVEEDIVEIDLRQMFDIILSRWYIIVGITLFAIVIAAIFSYMMDPVFESSTKIIIDQDTRMGSGESLFLQPFESGKDDMANRLQIIQSPLVINRAIELLNEEGNQEAVENIKNNQGGTIKTSNIGETDIIRIDVTGFSPEEARDGAWSIAKAYQDYRESRAQEQSQRVLSFLDDQVAKAEKEVEKAEEAVRDYQRKEGIISLDNEASKLNDQLSELESQQLNADISIREKKLRMEQINLDLEEIQKQLPEESITITESLLENLRDRLSDLEAQKIDYLNRGLSPDSPEVNSLDSQIENLEESIKEYTSKIAERPGTAGRGLNYYNELLTDKATLEAEVAGLESKMEFIAEKIDDYEDNLKQLSDKGYEMARLERNVDIAKNTYSMLSEELERSKIAVEREMSDVRLVENAKIPESPIRPRTFLNVFIAGFLGLFTGTGIIFLMEYLDTTIKEENELKQLTGLPVLGVIPDFERVDHASTYGTYGREPEQENKEDDS